MKIYISNIINLFYKHLRFEYRKKVMTAYFNYSIWPISLIFRNTIFSIALFKLPK